MLGLTRRHIIAAAVATPLAAAAPAAAVAGSAAADQAEVRAALAAFFDAARQADWRRIDTMLSPNFAFYTDGTTVLTRAQFLDAMKDDSMDIAKLELSDVEIRMSPDAHMALVRYSAYLESTIKGAPYNMRSVETVLYEKHAGAWKMAHNHASVRTLD